jgi:hypothetical protein
MDDSRFTGNVRVVLEMFIDAYLVAEQQKANAGIVHERQARPGDDDRGTMISTHCIKCYG